MFTGIIQDVGTLERVEPRGPGCRVTVATGLDLSQVALGDSIATNGVCLTAVAFGPGRFEADLSRETLAKTSLGDLGRGARVNLELALRVGDRLGGHIVQGHVDSVGRYVGRDDVGEGWELHFEIPEALLGQVVPKGSIALDGVSLTVARLEDPIVTIAVVPHTFAHTQLGDLSPGAPVNVETDMVGKYVQRLLARVGGSEAPGRGLRMETLLEAGFGADPPPGRGPGPGKPGA